MDTQAPQIETASNIPNVGEVLQSDTVKGVCESLAESASPPSNPDGRALLLSDPSRFGSDARIASKVMTGHYPISDELRQELISGLTEMFRTGGERNKPVAARLLMRADEINLARECASSPSAPRGTVNITQVNVSSNLSDAERRALAAADRVLDGTLAIPQAG